MFGKLGFDILLSLSRLVFGKLTFLKQFSETREKLLSNSQRLEPASGIWGASFKSQPRFRSRAEGAGLAIQLPQQDLEVKLEIQCWNYFGGQFRKPVSESNFGIQFQNRFRNQFRKSGWDFNSGSASESFPGF